MKYCFSAQLDLAKLQEFYDGDPRLAVGVFEAFVQETVTALPHLDQLYLADNVAELRRLVHKIKPGFLYVGLTSLYEKLNELELVCEQADQGAGIGSIFGDLSQKLKTEIPWVENELLRLKLNVQ
ncbi:MAG: Hpt domain-containing protein [Chitinophagaceae bacterium]